MIHYKDSRIGAADNGLWEAATTPSRIERLLAWEYGILPRGERVKTMAVPGPCCAAVLSKSTMDYGALSYAAHPVCARLHGPRHHCWASPCLNPRFSPAVGTKVRLPLAVRYRPAPSLFSRFTGHRTAPVYHHSGAEHRSEVADDKECQLFLAESFPRKLPTQFSRGSHMCHSCGCSMPRFK